MKGNRGMFEEWFPLKHLFNYLYWSEEQKNYVYNQYDEEHCRAYEYVNSSWSAWCASAQREGYKLVPLQPSNELIVAIERKIENQLEASGINQDPFRLDGETIYEAMIGVPE